MRESTITATIRWIWTDWNGEDHKKQRKEIQTMFIPKVIGNISKGFNTVFRNLKQLPLGHRCRGDVEI